MEDIELGHAPECAAALGGAAVAAWEGLLPVLVKEGRMSGVRVADCAVALSAELLRWWQVSRRPVSVLLSMDGFTVRVAVDAEGQVQIEDVTGRIPR